MVLVSVLHSYRDRKEDGLIKEFQGQYRWLSNFWICQVPIEGEWGLKYLTVEHAYQAAKCECETHAKAIQALRTPGEAKRAGRQFRMKEDWEEVKLEVMYDFVLQKFSKNSELKYLLLQTGDEELQEGNYWHDTFWGVDLRTGKGENHLGKILMRVRKGLR